MFGRACVRLYILGVLCVCSFCVLRQMFVTEILFFVRGRCGCRRLFVLTEMQMFVYENAFAVFSFFLFFSPFFFVYGWYATPDVFSSLYSLQFRKLNLEKKNKKKKHTSQKPPPRVKTAVYLSSGGDSWNAEGSLSS